MTKFTVLVTASHLHQEAQRILQGAGAKLILMPDSPSEPTTEDRLITALLAEPVHAILLRGSKPITARVLGASPYLKLVAKNGAGVDSVDLDAAKALGIEVRLASGANADAVAEHALALMLALVRDLPSLDAKVKRGGWEGATYQGRDFKGSVVGIVGLGAIGKRTADLAKLLGAQVLVYQRNDPESDFKNFLSQLDILSLHCPLNEQTRGLVGRAELAAMKRGSILINTARGGLVDEAALVQALSSGHLQGAGLDSFAHEPLPPNHPLTQLPNVILTPHVAGVTRQSAEAVAVMTAKNVVAFFESKIAFTS